MKVGIVSGYFNPVHAGHLQYVEASKQRCDHLVAIVNSDFQVSLKKSKPFMDEAHRCKIMGALRCVDEVILSVDTDRHVCKTMELVRNKYPNEEMDFYNSGDRVVPNVASVEFILCEKLGIKYVAICLPKLYSSSELLQKL